MAAQDNVPGFMARVAQAARYVISGVSSQTWFSPMQPLQPFAPAEVKGRQFDYQTGLNLNYRPRSTELVGFAKLRALAEGSDILRTVIERQKDLIEAFEWSIKPREDQPGRRPSEAKFKTEIQMITELLKTPDRDHDWSQWLRMLLEDVFVIDAPAIYRQPTADGQNLWGLTLIDGATVQVLVDATGRRPQAPDPAYVQVLKGVPAADFSRDELIYYPKNPRANRLYGCSPVQQIVDTIETTILRQASQKAYFQEGNIGDGMFSGPEAWSTDQIRGWQQYWDGLFEGNVAMRRKGWWVPNGTKFEQIKQPPLKDEFDEWLARVICFAFSTSPQPFIKQVSRGNQESQQQVAEDGGIATYMAYIKRLMDKVIREDFQQPNLEFSWSDDREFDPVAATTMDDMKLRNGSKTLNEVRDRNGDDPYPSDIGDTPMIYTAQGAITVEQAQAPPEPPAPPVVHVAGGGGAAVSGDPAAPPADPNKPAPKQKPVAKRAPFVVPIDTAGMQRARGKVNKAARAVLHKAKGDLVHQVTRQLLMMGKAAEDDPTDEAAQRAKAVAEAQKAVDALDLSVFDALPEQIEEPLAMTAEAGGRLAYARLGSNTGDDLTGQIPERALTYARERSAEMVGKSWDAEGNLIDNPDAKWAITEGTRNMLRDTIADGLANGLDEPAIADAIRESYAFSDERAATIANYEVAQANSQGSMFGAREAAGEGIGIKKSWLLSNDENVCGICERNEADGAIGLEDTFFSGDDAAPAHVRCQCSTTFEVDDEEADG